MSRSSNQQRTAQGSSVPQNQAAGKPAPGEQPVSQRGQAAAAATAAPSSPPMVTYRDGMLTVQASNSRLSSVISAIRNKTGIEFEGGEGASEPVALSLGPAPEGEVLSAIFAGSGFDFVAIGRQDSPGVVQRVILTPKTKGAAPGAQAQQPTPANGQNSDDEDTPDEQVNTPEPQDTPAQPPQQPQPETPPQQQPKSPEQLLQELQQMRLQKGSPPNDPTADQAPKKPQL
ncbi:MAG TPA: hypothetical protein VFB79_16135 [Candidatus Angelobacter sp.]|nr:hypothetical protein [Candidatus Angelobacter sp.]